MKPPDPRELEELVDRLNEQLNVLCSQDQEQVLLESLIDIDGLTNMTRAMLIDAERQLADCRRQPDRTDRPFLVTSIPPKHLQHLIEPQQPQAQTMLWKPVTACAGVGLLALTMGYALHKNWVGLSLVAKTEQERALLSATPDQFDSLTAAVNAPDSRLQLPPAPSADTDVSQQPAGRSRPSEDSNLGDLLSPLHTQRQVTESRVNLSTTRNDVRARAELRRSNGRTQEQLAAAEGKDGHNYYEFDIDKLKRFQKNGPVGIRLKKTNLKHQYADLELMVDDQSLSQKHVNLYEPVLFYRPDNSQPVEVVINDISKDHIHGYVMTAECRQSEMASNDPNNPAQLRSGAGEHQRSGGRWHGLSLNKLLSRVKLHNNG